ncbi:MAG: DUF4906 domain-containing protein [Parabacteroides sp.]|nr:DUF4906 domain-containing protein [Parabacteroides sp.]
MKRQFSIYGALAAIALFWGMLTGCEADDTPGGSSSGEVVPVTISLQMDEVDQLTKAVNENAINTLDVYIVQGNQTIHLTESDFDDSSWKSTSTVELVDEQTYRIYAIANAGNPYGNAAPQNEEVDALVQWLGTNATAIPMSTTEDTTWTVSSSQLEYKVRLNRMVAKMNVKIVDERADKAEEVGDITIAKLLLAQTPLYRSAYGVVASPSDGDDWTGKSMNDNEYFYLHENSGTFPISVTVGTASRTGNLEANIPRNHIFPLVIHIADYSLDIKVEYQLAAIGTLPVTKTLNTYSFALPEGCTFDVTIKPKKGKGNWENASWTVGELEGSNSSIVLDENWKTTSNVDINNPYEFSGMVSAIHPGDSYKCTIPISLTDGGKEYNFTIEMSTRPLGDGEYTRSYSVSAETEAVHIDL